MDAPASAELQVPTPRRVKPHHLALGLGVAFAAVTVGSGIAATVLQWHDDAEVQREVFDNIPSALRLAFYTVIPIVIVWGAVQFANRMKNWERGAPDRRRTTVRNAKTRLADLRSGLWMRTLLREPGAGIMHSLIYFNFLILLAVTTVLEVNHQMPENLKFLNGDVYRGYSFVGDLAGLGFTVGLVWAIIRRYGPRSWRPYRIDIKSRPEHAVILGVLLAVSLTGFGAEMFRIALDGRPTFERWSFIGYPLSGLVEGWDNLSGWHQGWWIAHVLTFIAFLIILPTTMLRHIFTSPLNMYLRDRERPKGAMKAMPDLETTELETFGASTVESFTWKQLLDTDACTMCGRCTSVCPAHATGKPLDPREIVLKTGEVMAATGDPAVSPPLGYVPEISIEANWVFERVTPEEVWACTSCKACDEICPVNIEILDKILDMRRYLTLMESNFPTELGTAFRSMENSSNPWAMSQSTRADWAKNVEVPIIDPDTAEEGAFAHEYLYWVGCAGSFDDKNQKVTQAMIKLLGRAAVDVAVLGPSELCTGDPARRSGNEYLFQMLAKQNVATLNGLGVRKIITQCPHCFNTLQNEYPQIGGEYEVVHHSQFLEWLIDSGRLDVTDATLEERIVYHDSCYLGRHNDVYLAPRNVIGSIGGVSIVEAGRNGTKGMCCGAGGARMWMEETIGKKVNDDRAQELIGTGASRVATACPFCYVMMDDGVKGAGKDEDEVRVGDIAQHLLEAIENGERRRAADKLGVAQPSFVYGSTPVSVQDAPVATEANPVSPERVGGEDDLDLIHGVDDAEVTWLSGHGISSYETLAGLSDDEVEALAADDEALAGRLVTEGWREEASELAERRNAGQL
jgi:Fe-S oxidoreductase/predicted flap endonuclease-1-like 5' DNA nuclease